MSYGRFYSPKPEHIKINTQLNFLIVDDTPTNRMIMRRKIKTAFPEAFIDEAVDGLDGIEKVADRIRQHQANYDVIIMDYEMPKKQGDVATKYIRALEDQNELQDKSFIITWSTVWSKPYPLADAFLKKGERLDNELKNLLNPYLVAHCRPVDPHQGLQSPSLCA